mmetsp:Transcript_25372/g.37469  ORF Transcript_25372/g.37469 Transcript_25372/m.37469 type:complete len:84 (-) Transcript_25372:965-1216(-)
MRDFQCGHKNMQTPRVLRMKQLGCGSDGTEPFGNGRIVVDIGLDEGQETLDAVEAGFLVLGFELIAASVEKMRSNAQKRGIAD